MYYRLCKKNSKFWISFLIIFFLFAGCNDSKWDSLNNKAIDLYNQAKYDEGLQVAKKALEIAEQKYGNNHVNVATSLNTLAAFYDSKKEYYQAEPLYKQALEMQEKILDPNNPEIATTLNNLACLYYSKEQYDKAEPLYKKALDIRDKNFKDNIDVANSIKSLATVYFLQNRDSEAKPLFERLLDIQLKLLGKNHPDIRKTQEIISKINGIIEDAHNKATIAEQPQKEENYSVTSTLPSNLEFKGLSLNMTRKKLNELINNSSWDYRYGYSKKSKEMNISLVAKNLANNFNLIGAEGPESDKYKYNWDGVQVGFFKDSIYRFSVYSPEKPANYIDSYLKEWLQVAYKGLVKKYGKPTDVFTPIESINVYQATKENNAFCGWQINNQIISLTLGYNKGDYTYYIAINFKDLELSHQRDNSMTTETYM